MHNSYSDRIYLKNGIQNLCIYFTAESGKIIYRDKIDTIIGIKHPGIVLGRDAAGTIWVVHNHYEVGYAKIVTLQEFSLGTKILVDLRELFYDAKEIVRRATESWKERREYSWLFHNCQHFVNKITKNKNYSESIDNISDKALMTGGIVTVLGLLSGNGTAVKVGLGISGLGVAGKVFNK